MTAVCRGVISDWGGVLTDPLGDTIAAWLAADGIDADHYGTVMARWFAGAPDARRPVCVDGNAIHALERGEVAVDEFERALAAELRLVDGGPVPAVGLIDRMFAAFGPVDAMYDVISGARRQGVRTTLLSNSWGNGYPRERFVDAFDALVISGEVGMRKPEPAIYRHAIGVTGVPAAECLFIDDLEHNVRAAEELGMRAVLHRDPAETRRLVAEACALDPRALAPG